MFNQVNLTGIVKSCNSVSFNGKPASALCVELFGDSSSVYMVSFEEIHAEKGDIIAVVGSLTTRKFDVQDGILIEADRRGYVRVIIDDHQLQKATVKTDNTQQSSAAQPNGGQQPAQSQKKDKNISNMENLVLVKKEEHSVWFAGYAEPFTLTQRTKNVVLLDVQQTVNAVVYTNEAGKMYLNEILPATKAA